MKPSSRAVSLFILAGVLSALPVVGRAQTLTWDANASTSGPQDGAGAWLTGNNWWPPPPVVVCLRETAFGSLRPHRPAAGLADMFLAGIILCLPPAGRYGTFRNP
jgi:hypothetical protein